MKNFTVITRNSRGSCDTFYVHQVKSPHRAILCVREGERRRAAAAGRPVEMPEILLVVEGELTLPPQPAAANFSLRWYVTEDVCEEVGR